MEAREAKEAKEVREAVEVMAALEGEGGVECQADEKEGQEGREDQMEGEVVDKISPPPSTSPKCMNSHSLESFHSNVKIPLTI